MGVSEVIALIAVGISILGYFFNSKKDSKQDAAANAQAQAKLDNLITGVNDIRIEFRTMRETITDHRERIITMEILLRQLSNRVDRLDGKRSVERSDYNGE